MNGDRSQLPGAHRCTKSSVPHLAALQSFWGPWAQAVSQHAEKLGNGTTKYATNRNLATTLV